MLHSQSFPPGDASVPAPATGLSLQEVWATAQGGGRRRAGAGPESLVHGVWGWGTPPGGD